MKTAVFQVRLEATPEAEINPFHLAEEIQAYLNAHVCSVNETTDTFEDVRVTGYKFDYDNFTPTQFDYDQEF